MRVPTERPEQAHLLPVDSKDLQGKTSPSRRASGSKARILALLALVAVSGHLYHANCPGRHALDAQTSVLRNPAYLIQSRNGAVASENKRCSDIGVNVLKDGGNAVDAAVAATFCTGVVNMFSSGIGGGGFMTIRIPTNNASTTSEVYTIDFREIAPKLANASMYKDDPKSAAYGGLAVGVPGEVRGLEEAHRRWGILPWKRLVEPAISLASGWEVDKELGKRIPWFSDLMLNNPDWSSIFAPNGRFLQEGETISRANLSRTLAVIAEEGADGFYKGPVADSIVRKVREAGGILSHEDLEKYSVIVRRALEGTFRDKKVYTTHAPTSGPVLLHMLNLLEHYDFDERNGLNVHRLVEIMKFGFAARTKICDLQFANDTQQIYEIPTKAFAQKIVGNITDDRTHPPEYYNPIFDVKTDHGTSHTSVVDLNGMAVSLTSTVNLVFVGTIDNFPAPGKRPLSSTAPTIFEHADGSFYLAIGGSGGSRIFPSLFQVIANLNWGMDISAAIEEGRLHDQLYPVTVDADNVYPPHLLHDLSQRGHNLTILDINRVAAVVQAVLREDSIIYAASDSRKNGIAAGY
ncbi:hypothetical protein D9619_001810 [Psilocybe cf. subviscida]|uniref:Glutathione hydrolase n=1 Tax=Psilocybe cf. subviscida TaxID=2480587 RepID=A0A8H5BEF3_9AGAR|nr:hypothetical protein D9619_001810 [Psilocybe cf. subviscida]